MSKSESQSIEKHHGTILRASVFTGGAQVVASLASLIRGKISAVLLGVTGVGIGGLLGQASSLIQSVAGLGLGSSGVRAIAAARARNDPLALARAVKVLRVWSWVTGIVACLLCVLFSDELSRLSFDSDAHVFDFKLLGVVAFFQQVSQGQSALLRGMGRIKELATLNVTASIAGLVASVPCLVVWGSRGIAPSLVVASFLTLVCTWWCVRREVVQPTTMRPIEIFLEGRELIYIGMAFVGTTIAGMAANYINGRTIRIEVGLEGNGYYQAASGITIILVGFVLSAMGQDYYPRLITFVHDKERASRLIKDQTEMAVLLAAPVLVFVSALSPLLLELAFSSHFVVAAPAVTWLALGCLGRVVSWPLGFALLAEGRPILILAYEGTFSAASVAFAWIGATYGGVVGASAAFATLYLIYWCAMSALIRRRFGFMPDRALLVKVAMAALAILAGLWLGLLTGIALSALVAVYCARIILRHIGPGHRIHTMALRMGPVARVLGLTHNT